MAHSLWQGRTQSPLPHRVAGLLPRAQVRATCGSWNQGPSPLLSLEVLGPGGPCSAPWMALHPARSPRDPLTPTSDVMTPRRWGPQIPRPRLQWHPISPWTPQICRVETRAPCAPEPSLTVISSPSQSLGSLPCPQAHSHAGSPHQAPSLCPGEGAGKGVPLLQRTWSRHLSLARFASRLSVCRVASRGTSVVRRESHGSGLSVGPPQWTARRGHGPAEWTAGSSCWGPAWPEVHSCPPTPTAVAGLWAETGCGGETSASLQVCASQWAVFT